MRNEEEKRGGDARTTSTQERRWKNDRIRSKGPELRTRSLNLKGHAYDRHQTSPDIQVCYVTLAHAALAYLASKYKCEIQM